MDPGMIRQMRELEERHWWFQGRLEILLSLVEAHLPAAARLLDVGCGTGLFLDAVRGRATAMGLDPSRDAVEFCHARGLTQVHRGTLDDLPRLGLSALDAVTFFDVLEHLPDDVEALTQVRAVLRPGGVVLATVPAYRWLWSPHDEANQHYRRYTRRRLRGAFERAGYAVVRAGYFNARLFPLAVPVRFWQRFTRRWPDDELDRPPAALNRWFRRILAGEARRIGRIGSSGYPAGLSVFAVARVPA